jgi:filamentous hemagglutinin family protein
MAPASFPAATSGLSFPFGPTLGLAAVALGVGLGTPALGQTAPIVPPQGAALYAQILPDDTLGAEGSTLRDTLIRGDMGTLIEGGATRGAALFHSFGEFSIGEGQRAYFANPSGIETIFGRVTGLRESQINGLLGVDGSAHLFLLNPNGILFGPQARLDLSGSFHASTAQKFVFAPGVEFSAVNPQAAPLLTIQPQPDLIYDVEFSGDIFNEGHLAVGTGQTLTLAGAKVTQGGYLGAAGGTVQLLGDRIEVLGTARIDVSAEGGGGTVRIGGDYQGQGNLPRAQETTIAPGALLEANALRVGDGGEIIIWSDQATYFAGTALALGGSAGGNGGLVETSSQGVLTIPASAQVSTTAPQGQGGQWLLDPRDITISSAADNNTPSGTNPITYAPNGNNSVVNIGTIVTALNAGNHVIITTGTGGPDPGNITIANPLATNATTAANLTLQAANSIILSDTGSITLGTGILTLDAPALDFSGQTTSGTYTLTNTGTGNLSGSGISFSAGGSAVFQNVTTIQASATATGDRVNDTTGNNSFALTGAKQGTISGISFQNIEQLDGGGGTDTVTGTSGADSFLLDTTAGSFSAQGISFSAMEEIADGGDTNDTLIADSDGTYFTITDTNRGTIDTDKDNNSEITFSGISRITGGDGGDRFTFNNTGSLTGAIDGGTGNDNDTLVGDNDGNAFEITGANSGTLTEKTSGWSNIEALVGGINNETVLFTTETFNGSIDGGDGTWEHPTFVKTG